MPISGQTALTTIAIAKELEVGYQPITLAEITFADGSIVRLASENLDSTLGGPQYNGVDWAPLLTAQEFTQMSSVSSNGIIQSPTITFRIADANRAILNACELVDGRGFKGAKLRIYFVKADLAAATFSSDSRVVFVGYCDPPSWDAESITVTATNLLNMTRRTLPTAKVSLNCIWPFPSTAAQRADAANNSDSPFYPCGYSPDIAGPNARGNYQPGTTTPYTSCTYDRASCIARMGDISLPAFGDFPALQLEQDTSARATARFSGLEASLPMSWAGKEFISSTKQQGLNDQNDNKFTQIFPLVYGTEFVNPVIDNVAGDPNNTYFRAIITLGKLTDDMTTQGSIQAVIVNDVLVPFYYYRTDDSLTWSWGTTGDRTGACTRGAIYNLQPSDCFGSMAMLLITVPKSVQASNGIPNVRILTKGPQVRVFTSDSVSAFTEQFSANPCWILLDILLRCGWKLADINLGSFVTQAAYCDVLITYSSPYGAETVQNRYRAGLVYQQARTAAECLAAFLASFRGMLRIGSDGRLELIIRKTLAEQQPSAVSGSNNSSPITSIKNVSTAATAKLYPTVLTNGWGPNAHVGPYEEGVDDATNWGLDTSTTVGFTNTADATDGNESTYASLTLLHQHTYGACIWSFASSTATPSQINILSEVLDGSTLGVDVNHRSSGIWYSLDGGSTWTMLFNEQARPKQWDNVFLSPTQDLSQVQIMAFVDAHDDQGFRVYEVNISTVSGSSSTATANGYLAYDFDDSNILLKKSGDNKLIPDIKFAQRPIADTPNTLSVAFQDEEYNYNPDSLTLVDADDYGRITQQVQGSQSIEGFVNYGQANRILQEIFAQNFRGNPRTPVSGTHDTGGTWDPTWTTTDKGIDLRCGDIVRMGSVKFGIDPGLYRVTAITPAPNYETMTITGRFHKDEWYLDGISAVSPARSIWTPSTSQQDITAVLFLVNGT